MNNKIISTTGKDTKEIKLNPRKAGFPLFLILFSTAVSILLMFLGFYGIDAAQTTLGLVLAISIAVISTIYACAIFPLLLMGIKTVQPNEALVVLLFGKYKGTVREPGFYYLNPFSSYPVLPQYNDTTNANMATETTTQSVSSSSGQVVTQRVQRVRKRISLKEATLNNNKQKINDLLGSPLDVGIIVIWHVEDTAKALFNVDNYIEYVATQADSALRSIVRQYPYDSPNEDEVVTLRGDSEEVSEKIRKELQDKVELAGIVITTARITNLSYSPEIAAAMLQRQQASALVDARQLIVEGAVGMVEMALDKLKDNGVVNLDEERKAAMVSNLLVVLCGSKEAQPVVNSGSLY